MYLSTSQPVSSSDTMPAVAPTAAASTFPISSDLGAIFVGGLVLTVLGAMLQERWRR